MHQQRPARLVVGHGVAEAYGGESDQADGRVEEVEVVQVSGTDDLEIRVGSAYSMSQK